MSMQSHHKPVWLIASVINWYWYVFFIPWTEEKKASNNTSKVSETVSWAVRRRPQENTQERRFLHISIMFYPIHSDTVRSYRSWKEPFGISAAHFPKNFSISGTLVNLAAALPISWPQRSSSASRRFQSWKPTTAVVDCKEVTKLSAVALAFWLCKSLHSFAAVSWASPMLEAMMPWGPLFSHPET